MLWKRLWFGTLFPIACVPASPQTKVEASTQVEIPPAAPIGASTEHACDVVLHGEEAASAADESAAQRFCAVHIFGAKLDQRDPKDSSLRIVHRGFGGGRDVAKCVDEWVRACDWCYVFGDSTLISNAANYEIINVELGGGDGEYVYYLFQEALTRQTIIALRETNFAP